MTNALLILVFLFFVCTVVFTSKERFLPLEDSYIEQRILVKGHEQRYLDFLFNVNKQLDTNIKGVFKGSCNDTVNKQTQNKVLNTAYENLKTTTPINFSKDPCVSLASNLCEYTDPTLYISQTNFPLGLRNTPAPKHTDLYCFSENYACCRQAKLQN